MAVSPGPRTLSRRALLPFAVLVVLVWGWAARAGRERPAPDLYPFLRLAWPGADFRPLSGGAFEISRRGEPLGQAAAASADGYGGPLTVAVGAGLDGRIASVALVEYRDTPDLLRSTGGLLRSLLGKGAGEPFRIGRDLDAVTGATFSSRGIAEAAGAAVAAISERGGGPGAAGRGVELGAPEATLLALFALAGFGRHRRRLSARARSLLRGATLGASLATLGFLFDRPWVIAFPIRLLGGDWPSFRTHLYGYLTLAGLLLVFDRSGRGPYCPWICPFGAAQELAGRLGGARRRRPGHPLLFAWVKRTLLAAVVALALLHGAASAASYEIFGTLFRGAGSPYQVGVLVFALLVAVFVSRPWCHWLCPIDPLERGLAAARRRLLRRLGRAAPPPAVAGHPRLPVVAAGAPARDPLRRARDLLVAGVGLFCLALTLAHLADRFARQPRGAPEGLLGSTFVAAPR